MEVTITQSDLATVADRGTMWTMTGTGPAGERVTFGGDWRPMRDMCAAVEDAGEVIAEVEDWQITRTVPLRRAVVTTRNGRPTLTEVQAYMPGNYTAVADEGETIVIEGHDNAGWTLEDYVIPRLASGLISAREVTE
jgi:hypothetical protein